MIKDRGFRNQQKFSNRLTQLDLNQLKQGVKSKKNCAHLAGNIMVNEQGSKQKHQINY